MRQFLEHLQSGPARFWRTRQLLDFGLGHQEVRTLRRTGRLQRLRRGCYYPQSAWEQRKPWEQDTLRILAHAHVAVRASTGRYAYSHATAARLHGWAILHPEPGIHVTSSTRPGQGQHAPDVVAHTAPLPAHQTEVVAGVVVTAACRTAVDCARSMSFTAGMVVMDQALRSGVHQQDVLDAAHRLSGHRGVVQLRRILDGADSRSESPGESCTRVVLARMNLKQPTSQLEVRTPRGVRRLDFGWENEKLALEFDGSSKYFDFKATDQAILEERQREKLLMEQGWFFIRISWADLRDEAALKQRILAGLRRNR